MRIPAKITDTFSPYLDDQPVVDFLDDFGRRAWVALAATLILNIAFFSALMMSVTYVLIPPPEPEVIPVQIVTVIGDTDEPPAPTEEPIVAPAVPTPSPAPAPRPRPKPQLVSPPQPAPQPEPEPEVAEEPEPVPQLIPPAPEIISQPDPEPTEESIAPTPDLPTEADRQRALEEFQRRTLEAQTPEEIILPEIEPEIEIIPDTPPEIIIDTPPELIPPIAQPIIEPELVIDPPEEPQPFIEIFDAPIEPEITDEPPAPVVEDFAPGPIIEDLPITPPEEIIETPELPEEVIPDAAPGLIEPIDITPVQPEAPITIEPEIQTPPSQEPDVPDSPADDAPITTAPRVLADDESAQTQQELERAVPQSQADTGPSSSGGGYQTPTIGGGGRNTLDPNAGTNFPTGPTTAGTGRPNPGADGWSLGEGAQGDYAGEGGLRGVAFDTRCRDIDRTHEDCPEYVAKPRGRAADGYETPRINRAPTNRGVRGLGSVGRDTSTAGGNFGASSNGMPSETVLDDADFGVLYGRTPQVDIENAQPRLSDLFSDDQDFVSQTETLPELGTAPADEDEDDPWALDTISPQ